MAFFLALLAKMRGASVSFNDIGKGFSNMSPGFLVAFLSGLPFVLVAIGGKLFELWMDEMDRAYPGDEVPPEVLMQMATYLAGLVLLYAICFLVTGVIFPFAYQLVVDKHLSGWEATKLSARAAQENFGGVMGLLLLELALSTFGIMLCCFGLVLVMPLTKSSWAIAYSQVFLPPQQPMPTPQPPPPPVFYGNAPTIWRVFLTMNSSRLVLWQFVFMPFERHQALIAHRRA